MGVYGYCVVPAGHEAPRDLAGLDGTSVSSHDVGRLLIWYSAMDRPEPTADHVKGHNEVIEAAVTEAVTPVPLRFGQWADEMAVFDGVLTEKSDWYAERLETFAGAMEFGLRIVQPDAPASAQLVRVPRAETGTAYMESLRASAAAARATLDEGERIRGSIAALMSKLVREERIEEARTPHGILTLSHLVAREQFVAYREQVQVLRNQFPSLRFLSSGPWVPYSFAA